MAITFVPVVEDVWIEGTKRHARVRLSTAASGNTYTTNGDLIPLFGAMGMKRNLDYIVHAGDDGFNGFILKYDVVSKKIRIYYADYDAVADGALIEYVAAGAYNSRVSYWEVVGW